MNCDQVREVLDKKLSVEKKDEVVLFRHIHGCSKCREEIPVEIRVTMMHSIIMANE